MSFGAFELLLRIDVRPRITRMLGKRAVCPVLSTFEIVIIRVVGNEVDCQLAPDEQFVDERFLIGFGRICVANGERDCERTDVPEVQIRRKAAGSVEAP